MASEEELTLELTSMIVMRGTRALVRVTREWSGEDLWRVSPDTMVARGEMVDESVIGCERAKGRAITMARALVAYADGIEAARRALRDVLTS